MPIRPSLLLTLLISFIYIAPLTLAQPESESESPADTTNADEKDDLTVVHKSVSTQAGELNYTVTTGYMPMNNEEGELLANVFFVAYTLDSALDPADRPITFVFNGGPGSSSVWLHLGTAGPRRAAMGPEGFTARPPYKLLNNDYTWLDATDLVFIDPVGTGYSRPADEHEQKEFSGLSEDIHSVGDFIHKYVTRYQRWASPKFLAGESYGTTRAAGLSGYLQNRHGMYLNGIMLVSAILNFQTARFDEGNDLPYILFLPTYTATAHFHNRLPADLQRRPLEEVLREVEEWALTNYLTALAQGDNLSDQRQEEITRTLARYTGLSEEYVRASNMRIHIMRFTKELMRDQRRSVGRLDSRFIGIDSDAAGETFDHDPSMTAIMGPYTAMLNDYLRRELEYENELPYEILTGRVHPWSYSSYENSYVNVAKTLRQAMTKNESLHVFIASGRYDLATPYFATDYTINHLGLEPHLQNNITTSYFPAGHMMYIQESSLRRLHSDIKQFIENSANVE